MRITFANFEVEFCPWRPEMGRVFESVYSFDSETTLIDMEHPWITPTYVLGAACDGQRGFFVRREHVAAFFEAHQGIPVVMHHAPFDLEVVHLVAPELDIYRFVDAHLIWDTRLLHQLYMLGVDGHTAQGKGQSTLEHCAEYYLGATLPKDVCDAQGHDVRTSYGQWLGRPANEIEPVYLEYLAKDAMATLLVFHQQRALLHGLLENSHTVWGYVSPGWLSEQVHRWGWQTHHIQLKGAIVLRAITANGLGVDLDRRDELINQLDEVIEEKRNCLRPYGYLPGQPGSGKALQEILRRLERDHPDFPFPKTPTGKYASSREALMDLAGVEPFVQDFLDFHEIEKLKTSFLTKMGRRRLHPSFNALMVSGRTSSHGEINAQNLPRDDRVRSCFIPSEGRVFIDADYATLEMATLAQSAIRQFGQPSYMAGAINARQDLHRLVASQMTGKAEQDVTAEERQKAKPVNFGLPGGMGPNGLKRYSKSSYGVELSDEEVERLTEAWFRLFPEMEEFLGADDLGERAARLFGLTPMGFFEHTGSRTFLDHPANGGRENIPHAILGGMLLKTLKTSEPKTRNGAGYRAEEIDYFWARVTTGIHDLPAEHHAAVIDRRASPGLQRAVIRVVDRAPCFTLTGRLRANASYCARHNTIFQGLAADGAKLALWRLWRSGFRLANFIHDEVLVEVPEDANLHEQAETIRCLMIEGMREVAPDVRIEVEYAAARRWSKKAKANFDDNGRLLVWEERTPITTT